MVLGSTGGRGTAGGVEGVRDESRSYAAGCDMVDPAIDVGGVDERLPSRVKKEDSAAVAHIDMTKLEI